MEYSQKRQFTEDATLFAVNRENDGSPFTARMVLLCYPGESGSFTLYEDDGVTEAYKNGSWLKTELSYISQDGRVTLEIHPEGKGYEGMPEQREYTIRLAATKPGMKIANGMEAEVEYADRVTTIRIPKRAIWDSVVVELEE
ncbi:MAG: DUF5110 domain-containing protein [Lachnospiraceae bacterium]|nr:DUF5110 domain-containing protein [Lachnospiraceae bacterium]